VTLHYVFRELKKHIESALRPLIMVELWSMKIGFYLFLLQVTLVSGYSVTKFEISSYKSQMCPTRSLTVLAIRNRVIRPDFQLPIGKLIIWAKFSMKQSPGDNFMRKSYADKPTKECWTHMSRGVSQSDASGAGRGHGSSPGVSGGSFTRTVDLNS
jgi:hypothetical protein